MNTNSANSAYEKNEKTVDKYIKAIKKEFPIYRKGEKRYLKMLRSSMYDYAVSFEGELITVSHLSKKFGSPKDCANTYIEYLGTDTICHNMNGKKYGKYIFITALSVILGFAICISVMLYKEWQISRRTDIASTTIIIQDGVGQMIFQSIHGQDHLMEMCLQPITRKLQMIILTIIQIRRNKYE